MAIAMKTRLTTREDIEDFVHGLAFLATGGGGPMPDGLEILTEELEAGREIGWVDADAIPEDAWTVTTSRIGGPAPKSGGPTREELALYGLQEPDVHGNEGGKPRVNRQVVAVRELAKFAKVEIDGIVPLELGGGNLPGALVTANRLGIATIDGDYTGRAIPELGNMKVEIAGLPCAPICFVDRWNNITIVKEIVGAAMADRVGRMLGVASFGRLGLAAYLLRARDAKRGMVRNSLSLSLEMGRAIRQARSSRRPIEQLVKASGGWLLFKGRVTGIEWETRGFQHYLGTHFLEGIDEFDGRTFRKWFKNENHVAWLDDQPVATSPDLISAVNLKTGTPITNLDIREGQELAVIGMKVLDPTYRSAAALDAFSAKHFGFDIEYVPIEKRFERSGAR